MKVKSIVLVTAAVVVVWSAVAGMGTARFSAVVVDEKTGKPMSGVPVIGVFVNHYLRWENASEEIVQRLVSDKRGQCRFSGKTNCGEAAVRVRNYA